VAQRAKAIVLAQCNVRAIEGNLSSARKRRYPGQSACTTLLALLSVRHSWNVGRIGSVTIRAMNPAFISTLSDAVIDTRCAAPGKRAVVVDAIPSIVSPPSLPT
jgi:hypothetical protein